LSFVFRTKLRAKKAKKRKEVKALKTPKRKVPKIK